MSKPKKKTTKRPALQPCPFCGSKHVRRAKDAGYIICDCCCAQGPLTASWEFAELLWNRRLNQ